MKHRILIALLVSVFGFQLATAQESYTKDVSKLPATARDFVAKHFTPESVSYILIDKEIVSTEYEVVLTNGQEIKFNKDGEWKEMEGKKKALPHTALPEVVQTYMKANFPETSVEQIEKEYWGYDIELLNNLEVKLDKKGNLLKIEH